ncbi:MAG TPA: DUF6644 family protein [Casimicrobiaceae bacterium]
METPLHSIESSGLGRFMREALWAYPIAETLHIIGIAALYGSLLVVELRLFGLGRRIPITSLARLALPWSVSGFILAAAMGLCMFSAHAAEFIVQRIFMLKMGLILVAGINAAIFHSGPFVAVARWDTEAPPPTSARVAAALSIVLWTGVIVCGRMLAYF